MVHEHPLLVFHKVLVMSDLFAFPIAISIREFIWFVKITKPYANHVLPSLSVDEKVPGIPSNMKLYYCIEYCHGCFCTRCVRCDSRCAFVLVANLPMLYSLLRPMPEMKTTKG